MMCKWHSELGRSDFPGSPVGSQGDKHFTAVSHSCQVFVTGVR